jgi:protein-disulfide isomerase
MAACVQVQDKNSFWKLHDFLYDNQDGFSAANIRSEVEDFLAKQGKLNTKAFERCVDNNESEGQVESDMQMAHSLGINETPTLFLNGVQLHRVHELQQLEDAVDSALKNKTAAKLD